MENISCLGMRSHSDGRHRKGTQNMNMVFHRDESFRYDVGNGRVNHEVPS